MVVADWVDAVGRNAELPAAVGVGAGGGLGGFDGAVGVPVVLLNGSNEVAVAVIIISCG